MLKIIYDSMSGQGKRFANNAFGHLDLPIIDINDIEIGEDMEQKYFLCTRSFGFGEIPKTTDEFMKVHHNQVIGIAVSGNKNWGQNYGACGDKLQAMYDLDFMMKYEGSGFKSNHEEARNFVEAYLNKEDK